MRRSRAQVVAVAMVALLTAACGGVLSNGPTTPMATATPEASATSTLSPTPRPTSTPMPPVEEPPPSGGVTMTMSVACNAGDYGLELWVRFGGRIRDTEDPAATITRVRVFVDGALREDSGPLSHRVYMDEAKFLGLSRRAYTVQLRVETWAAPQPRDIVQVAQCPPLPDRPAA